MRIDYRTMLILMGVQPRMTYASSKETLKNALPGLGHEVQANREDEIEYETILKDVTKASR